MRQLSIFQEPNLGTSRLSLLIDSLASGADVFVSGSHKEQKDNINEMEVVLEQLKSFVYSLILQIKVILEDH